jgi:hypothetical protein
LQFGKTVSVTVSFGEKVQAVQFALNFDTSKFDYLSCSAGRYDSNGTRYFVFNDEGDINSLASVTFTFKAKELGSGTFNISGLVTSNSANRITTSSATVTVQKQSTSSSTTNKPNQNPTPTPEEPSTPEEFSKTELETVESLLFGLIETDYTEESWKELQEAIEKARNAGKKEEYDEIKSKLTIDNLVIEKFEKTELNKLLRDLIGKSEADYTEESWKELQDIIEEADKTTLKSEYDGMKYKLTIDTLEEAEKNFFEPIVNFFQGLDEQERISLALGVCVVILLIIIIVIFILYRKEKKKRRQEINTNTNMGGARRLR